MVKTVTKHQVFSNLFWRFLERTGAQLVSFIVSIILARLLLPEDYGTIALVMVFISILQVFVDSGLGNALIQKKDADDIDFSTVFFTNIVFCIVIYILLFFFAPVISRFYGRSSLASVIRVLGLTVVISGVKNIQQAYVSKNFLFRKFFFSSFISTGIAAIVGIVMAINGFGIWSLIIQQICNLSIATIILWSTVGWHPVFNFSFHRLSSLLSFGWKLLVAALFATFYEKIGQLIIGKKYSTHDLAFYNRGESIPSLFVQNFDSSFNSVLLPALSVEQDNKSNLKSITRRSIQIGTYIISPMMIGLFCIANTFVEVLLTDKWISCVFYLRLFCVCYLFRPIFTASLNLFNATGRSDLYLKVEVLKKITSFTLLFMSMWISVKAIAFSILLSSFLEIIYDVWPCRKLVNYSFMELFCDVAPNIVMSLVMGLGIYTLGSLHIDIVIVFFLLILLGVASYILLSFISHNVSYCYLYDIIKAYFQKKKEYS